MLQSLQRVSGEFQGLLRIRSIDARARTKILATSANAGIRKYHAGRLEYLRIYVVSPGRRRAL